MGDRSAPFCRHWSLFCLLMKIWILQESRLPRVGLDDDTHPDAPFLVRFVRLCCVALCCGG